MDGMDDERDDSLLSLSLSLSTRRRSSKNCWTKTWWLSMDLDCGSVDVDVLHLRAPRLSLDAIRVQFGGCWMHVGGRDRVVDEVDVRKHRSMFGERWLVLVRRSMLASMAVHGLLSDVEARCDESVCLVEHRCSPAHGLVCGEKRIEG
jgi:hypothetical protein